MSDAPTEPTVPESMDPTGQVFVQPDDESPTPVEASTGRGVIRTATVISGRVILGAVAVAAVATVVVAAILLPIPTVRSSATSTVVTPVPTSRQLVCPGGLLRLGSASGKGATTVSAIGSPSVVTQAQPGDVTQNPFASTDAGTAGSASAPMLLGTPAVVPGATPPLLAGSQSETINTSEFFGLASAECTAATGSTWLSGGSTAVGRTTLLLLANPTGVPAVVSLQVFGESGQITAPGTDGIAVPAGAQRVLSLAGFAPGLTSPIVHVQSTGGQVVASLEQSTVRGVTPGGVDFIAGTPGPALTTVLPGVVVSGTEALQALQGQSGFDDLQTTIRLYSQSTKPTKATITILAENGTVTGKPLTTDLQPGSVTDLPLDQLSDGSYTVEVTSKAPIVASVRVSTAAGAGAPTSGSTTGATSGGANATDFAWITPASLLTSSVLVPIVSEKQTVLHLDNPSSKPETVHLVPSVGVPITKVVPAHHAVAIPVLPGRTYRMTGFTELYATVSSMGTATVTSYGVSPLARGEGPLRVYG